jgi:hypothetical protein
MTGKVVAPQGSRPWTPEALRFMGKRSEVLVSERREAVLSLLRRE